MIRKDSTQETGRPAGHADVVAQLAVVPDALRRIIAHRSSDHLRLPGHDGGNAAVEIICHLRDWEEITGERVWRMLYEDSPLLEGFDDSLWSIEHSYLQRDALEALEAFALLRANLVGMLAGIEEHHWARTAELHGHGPITLRELLIARAGYDARHLAALGEALR